MFWKCVAEDCRRAILSVGFWTGVMLCAFVILLDSDFFTAVGLTLRAAADMTTYMSNVGVVCLALYFGIFPLSRTFFCVLAYTGSYSDEWNSRSIYAIVNRTGYRRYALSKVISNAMAGGLIMSMGMLLACALISAIFLPSDPYGSISTHLLPLEDTVFRGLYSIRGGWPFLWLQIFQAGLYGMVWATVGLAMSGFIPNRYLAMAGPTVLAFVFSYLSKWAAALGAAGLGWLDPARMYSSNFGQNVAEVILAYGYQLFLLFIAAHMFYKAAGRRLFQ